MEVSIQSTHLKAAAIFTAAHDVRYYLRGVLAEVRPTETRLVATDGSCAAVLRDIVLVGEQPNMPDVIIPNETVKLALLTKSQVLSPALSDDGKWSLAGISFIPVDGKFPDYRRIIPSQASGEAGYFDTEILGRFLKAAKALGTRQQPILRQNGPGDGAQVQIPGHLDEFVGVIMPMRMFGEKHPDPGIATWGHERL